MAKVVRIVNYAVNGGGVGHLVRLVGINRWLRRYVACLGMRAEVIFLTSSEADGMLLTERMAAFKLPSPTVALQTGLGETRYLAMGKQWVWHSLALLQPDLFIADTWPMGAFGELAGALDLCRHKAFIYRPVVDDVAERPDFQAMLPLYDRIVVPQSATAGAVRAPAEVADRLHYTGPMMVRERSELVGRLEARDRLGIASERLAVYVSAGGGGDPTAERRLLDVCTALGDDPDLHLVVGAGPLYRGRVLQGERLTWLAYGGMAELMAGLDVAVCGAGYNTFSELMHAGVPTVFMPLDKQADAQGERAAQAVAAGAAVLLEPPLLGAKIEAAIAPYKDAQRRAAAARAARALVPDNHARQAAAHLLELVLPPHHVQAATAAVDDDVLACARRHNLGGHHVIAFIRALTWRHGGAKVASAAQHATASTLAVEMVAFVVERQIPRPVALLMLALVGRRCPRASMVARARATRTLLQALCPCDDWPAAYRALQMLPDAAGLAPRAFVAQALARRPTAPAGAPTEAGQERG